MRGSSLPAEDLAGGAQQCSGISRPWTFQMFVRPGQEVRRSWIRTTGAITRHRGVQLLRHFKRGGKRSPSSSRRAGALAERAQTPLPPRRMAAGTSPSLTQLPQRCLPPTTGCRSAVPTAGTGRDEDSPHQSGPPHRSESPRAANRRHQDATDEPDALPRRALQDRAGRGLEHERHRHEARAPSCRDAAACPRDRRLDAGDRHRGGAGAGGSHPRGVAANSRIQRRGTSGGRHGMARARAGARTRHRPCASAHPHHRAGGGSNRSCGLAIIERPCATAPDGAPPHARAAKRRRKVSPSPDGVRRGRRARRSHRPGAAAHARAIGAAAWHTKTGS